MHPYLYEIDLCDFLYKYCQKQDAILNGRLYENKGASDFVSRAQVLKANLEQERREMEEKRRKAIEEKLVKGVLMRADVVNEKKQAAPVAVKPVEAQPKKGAAAATEEPEDASLNLDYGIIQKFGRLNITAPIFKEDLQKVLKDLEELKFAFLQKGDEEKEQAKARFLKESRRARGIVDEVPKEEEKGEAEEPVAPTKTANADKLKIVEQISKMKRAQTGKGGPRRARRGDDDDGGIDFGEDGIDIDTYESSYVPTTYTPGDDEEGGAATGGPLGGRDDYDRRGGRRGGQRGGRGGQRGGRGGYGDDRRSKSRGPNNQRGYY